jgi:hypothetical protein
MQRRLFFQVVTTVLLVLALAGQAPAKDGREVRFAVFSDPHLYHAALGTEGAAFERYLAEDRKMIRESEAILDAAIRQIIKEKSIRFVLVPGDLTKDGERFNHFLFALKMRKLEAAGIQVFVVPGNHDVNNPHAFRYRGAEEIPVANASPEMFAWIYRRCGYGQTIARDPSSLSYVAEPAKGVWLIAMDSCRYDTNLAEGSPVTGGRFTPQTLEWVLRMIRQGKAAGKQLIGMMHHGVVEHYTGQSQFFPDYVVEGWESVSKALAEAGLEVVFTGHYHANDVTQRAFEGNGFLFDIETGSLVTHPSPFRIVTLRPEKEMELESRFIDAIRYDTGKVPFPEYARDYLLQGMTGIVYQTLRAQFGLPEGEPTRTYAEYLATAFMAHYAGDEAPPPEALALIQEFLGSGDPVGVLLGQYLGALWSDLPPADSDLTIDLAAGTAE